LSQRSADDEAARFSGRLLSACNDGAIVSYTANPGYTGADVLTMEIIYPDGIANKRHHAIDVRWRRASHARRPQDEISCRNSTNPI